MLDNGMNCISEDFGAILGQAAVVDKYLQVTVFVVIVVGILVQFVGTVSAKVGTGSQTCRNTQFGTYFACDGISCTLIDGPSDVGCEEYCIRWSTVMYSSARLTAADDLQQQRISLRSSP